MTMRIVPLSAAHRVAPADPPPWNRFTLVFSDAPTVAPPSKPSFFTNMVECAAAGMVTPAMVERMNSPAVRARGTHPAVGGSPLLTLTSLVGISEDACAEVKTDPQASQPKAHNVVANSDPVKDATAEDHQNPMQAHFLCRRRHRTRRTRWSRSRRQCGVTLAPILPFPHSLCPPQHGSPSYTEDHRRRHLVCVHGD